MGRACHKKISARKANGRDHFEDLGREGKVILEWILRKLGGKVWTGCIWLRIGSGSALVNTILQVPKRKGNFLTR
jgi:hypothetical protein